MNIAPNTVSPQAGEPRRTFSLPLYLLLVFGLSWPFQIAYAVWQGIPSLSYLLSSLAMIMVTVGTFIYGRYILGDGFANAGWRWGKPKQYLLVFGLAALVFMVPTILEPLFGLRSLPAAIPFAVMLGGFAGRFLLTLLPGFGEEFGWRAYLLPHLAQCCSLRKALLLHAVIWWAWHIPSIIGIAAREAESGASVGATIVLYLLITLIPSMGNAVIYAYVWTATQSLAVASVYHSAYDEVRDAIEKTIGFGPLVSIWEMLVTTILGAVLLWKASWKALPSGQPDKSMLGTKAEAAL